MPIIARLARCIDGKAGRELLARQHQVSQRQELILCAVAYELEFSICKSPHGSALSLSSFHRRLRELEQSGAIERYQAIVSPAAVGLTFEAVVFVTIDNTNNVAALDQAVITLPKVVAAERLFGEPTTCSAS